MAFQTSMLASEAFALIRNYVPQIKAQAQGVLSVMQANNVNTDYVFSVLNQLNQVISSLNTWKAVAGLDTYATAQGYPNTITADCTATATAAQNAINWVVTNFPNSGGFLLDYTLNADGTRTPRSFTPANTVGLQTALSALIATIN